MLIIFCVIGRPFEIMTNFVFVIHIFINVIINVIIIITTTINTILRTKLEA